jgi:serine/threonine-protein kinase
MTNEQIESFLMSYINKNEGIINYFGHFKFSNSDRIGQGGNGLVYSATIAEKRVAIKFLISDSKKKYLRFKSEFFNTNYVKYNLFNVVNMIHYDELRITDELTIPYIIMSQYEMNLKKYRATIDSVDIEMFKSLAKFLFRSVESLHNNGIWHRDIKPENILIDSEGRYYLSDFGIAHFDDEEFPIDNKTGKGERLANIEFSAPEQISNNFPVTNATDIYSLAQILYWFVFKTVNRGTGAEHIYTIFDSEDAYIFNYIIDKSIRNHPSARFQSISEIKEYYKSEKNTVREINPFDDMHLFSRSLLSVVPEFYNQVYYIEDKKEIEKLFSTIFSKKYNHSIEFNSGKGNNTISSIIKLENDEFLMDYRQINIIRVWGLITDDVYDDILLLEIVESQPYVINGEDHYYVARIENDEIVPINSIASGFLRYKGKISDVGDLNIQERNCSLDYKVIAIGPFHSCTIIEENDKFIEALQSKSPLTEDDVLELKKHIHRNRAYDIRMRL